MGQPIKAMGTCWGIRLFYSGWPSLVYLSSRSRKVAGGVCVLENGSHCLIGTSSPPFSTVHAPDVAAPLVTSSQFFPGRLQRDFPEMSSFVSWAS